MCRDNDHKIQFKLGNFYEHGIGVGIDMKKAIHSYTLSAKQDNEDSIKRLKILKIVWK
jgi:TPR repeat protein